MLMPNQSYAFWQPYDASNSIQPQQQHEPKLSPNSKKAFVFYDNVIESLGISNSGNMICPYSFHFVPSDLINCNIQILMTIKHTVTVERSLDNLVYANLKLKKLIEEHDAIQKRTEEIFSGLSIPFLNFQIQALEPTALTSVYGRMQRLNQSQHATTRQAGPLRQTNIENLFSLQNRIRRSANEPRYLSSRFPSRRSLQRPRYITNTQTGRRQSTPHTSRSSSSENIPHQEYTLETTADQSSESLLLGNDTNEEEEPSPVSRERRVPARIRPVYDEDPDLPWIIMFPIKTGIYLISHPIEALCYFTVIYFIIGAFRSKGRKE